MHKLTNIYRKLSLIQTAKTHKIAKVGVLFGACKYLQTNFLDGSLTNSNLVQLDLILKLIFQYGLSKELHIVFHRFKSFNSIPSCHHGDRKGSNTNMGWLGVTLVMVLLSVDYVQWAVLPPLPGTPPPLFHILRSVTVPRWCAKVWIRHRTVRELVEEFT